MLNSYNSKQVVATRGIAARATISGFSQNSAYAPDKKATKFIVTLKPVRKSTENATSVTMTDTCRCEGKITHDRGKLQVQADDALNGKTILNAFRLLANSKFISIDPNYGVTSENITVGQTINQMRLTGGSEATPSCAAGKPKKKHCFVPACVRAKKKTRIIELSKALFESEKKERKLEKTEEQQESEHESNQIIQELIESVPSVESSIYKCETKKTVNEIFKPRQLKNHSEVPSSTTGVNRIGKLENQVEEMRLELSQLRREFIPQKDVQHYAELENRLRELTLILCDLKSNCLRGSCSSEMQNEEFQNVQYIINPPCVHSETGTQTVRERLVEEKVLPTPRDNYRNDQQKEKICVCDDCECKESGECLIKHDIEPNVIMLDEPKLPRPRRVSSSPAVSQSQVHTPWNLKRISHDDSRHKPLTRKPSPRREEPPKQVPPPKQTRDSYTVMTDNSRRTSRERQNTRDSYTETHESSNNVLDCFGICGNPTCGGTQQDEPNKREREPQREPQRQPQPQPTENNKEIAEEQPQSSSSRNDSDRCSIDSDPSDSLESQESCPHHRNCKELQESVMETQPPCGVRNNTLQKFSSYCLYCDNKEVPIISEKLLDEILKLIRGHAPHDIALTILLQTDELYHINVSEMSSGLNIGCLYATEDGIRSGNTAHLFEEFLTFFIVDSRNTIDQKNKILHHTFEFIRKGDK